MLSSRRIPPILKRPILPLNRCEPLEQRVAGAGGHITAGRRAGALGAGVALLVGSTLPPSISRLRARGA